MPNEHGLRRCKCGNFFLVRELLGIKHVETTDIPQADLVHPEDLVHAVSSSRTKEIELAARLDYWHHLNHPYRDSYKAHRDREDAAYLASSEAMAENKRSWWQKLLKLDARQKPLPDDRPMSFPTFNASEEQKKNMDALIDLMSASSQDLRQLEIVELYREVGRFDDASKALNRLGDDAKRAPYALINDLIAKKVSAPVRYKL
jgi:hypothetical protein